MKANAQQESLESNENRLWRMRWCFFWVGITFCILWTIVAIAASVVFFSVTRSNFSIFISSAASLSFWLMRRLADYLFPMDEKRFQLKKMKILMKNRGQQVSTNLPSLDGE